MNIVPVTLDREDLLTLSNLGAGDNSPLLLNYQKELEQTYTECKAREILVTLPLRAKIAALNGWKHVEVYRISDKELQFSAHHGSRFKIDVFWGRRVPTSLFVGVAGLVAQQLESQGHKLVFWRDTKQFKHLVMGIALPTTP